MPIGPPNLLKKHSRSEALVIAHFLKEQRCALGAQNEAAEFKLRTERVLGGIFKALPKDGGGAGHHKKNLKSNALPEVTSYQAALEQAGVRKTSLYWEREAEVPEAEFDAFVAGSPRLSTCDRGPGQR